MSTPVSTHRIHGLDLARAIAIIGVAIAHLGPADLTLAWNQPSTWWAVSTGYPSALFAVLAGVSLQLIARRGVAAGGAELVRSRLLILVRGVILVVLGLVLMSMQVGIIIVLTAIGVSFILLTPVTSWPPSRVAALTAVGALVGPVLIWVPAHWPTLAVHNEFLRDLTSGAYPITAWVTYTLVGMLIYRVGLGIPRTMVLVGLCGTALTGVAKSLVTDPLASGNVEAMDGFVATYFRARAHSGGLLDVAGSISVAVLVIGLCVLLCHAPAAVRASYPLRAMGSMSLSSYLIHVFITAGVGGLFVIGNPKLAAMMSAGGAVPDSLGESAGSAGLAVPAVSGSAVAESIGSGSALGESFSWLMFGGQLLVLLVFAAVWKWRFRRDPAEWVMHELTTRAAHPAPGPVSVEGHADPDRLGDQVHPEAGSHSVPDLAGQRHQV